MYSTFDKRNTHGNKLCKYSFDGSYCDVCNKGEKFYGRDGYLITRTEWEDEHTPFWTLDNGY